MPLTYKATYTFKKCIEFPPCTAQIGSYTLGELNFVDLETPDPNTHRRGRLIALHVVFRSLLVLVCQITMGKVVMGR